MNICWKSTKEDGMIPVFNFSNIDKEMDATNLNDFVPFENYTEKQFINDPVTKEDEQYEIDSMVYCLSLNKYGKVMEYSESANLYDVKVSGQEQHQKV